MSVRCIINGRRFFLVLKVLKFERCGWYCTAFHLLQWPQQKATTLYKPLSYSVFVRSQMVPFLQLSSAGPAYILSTLFLSCKLQSCSMYCLSSIDDKHFPRHKRSIIWKTKSIFRYADTELRENCLLLFLIWSHPKFISSSQVASNQIIGVSDR